MVSTWGFHLELTRINDYLTFCAEQVDVGKPPSDVRDGIPDPEPPAPAAGNHMILDLESSNEGLTGESG